MIRLKKLISESTGKYMKEHGLLETALPTTGSPPIDGKTKQNARNWISGKSRNITSGFFRDDYWQPIQKLWKEFDKLELNWNSTGNKYHEEEVMFSDGSKHYVPMRKVWNFEIRFINNRDKNDVIYGVVTASGAGSVEDPLSRYDVTLTLG